MVLKVHIVDREHERLAHAQAVVIDETKEGFVARGVDPTQLCQKRPRCEGRFVLKGAIEYIILYIILKD